MMAFLRNIANAQRNAKALAITRTRLHDREARLRMLTSHATGGHTANWRRPINAVSVDISRHVSAVYRDGCEKGARDASPLRTMSPAELRVLDNMGAEIAKPLPQLAADAGVDLADVRAIVRTFRVRGYADFGHLISEDDNFLRGRGYYLAPKGERLQRELRVNPLPAWLANRDSAR